MSKLRAPALKIQSGISAEIPVGICMPVYATVNNFAQRETQYTIEQCCDLPYQLSFGIGPNSVTVNRRKAEARLAPEIKYVMHVDDDVLVPPGFASRFVSVLEQGTSHGRAEDAARIGVVSAVMTGTRGESQNGCNPTAIPIGKQADTLPPGTCFMYNRERTPIEWDTNYQGSQWEDTDAMMQVIAQGYRCIATGNVIIMHRNNWTKNTHWDANRAYFKQKWEGTEAWKLVFESNTVRWE